MHRSNEPSPHGTRSRALAIIVPIVLTVAILLAGAPPAPAAGATALLPATTPSPPTLSVSKVIAALATEGVGVYASPGAAAPLDPITKPVVPFRILQSQAVIDAAQIANLTGSSGAALNDLIPLPAHAPPFSYLLAAYAKATKTPGETLAGRLLGRQDWIHPGAIAFPALILTLFEADALRAAATGNAHATSGPAVASPMASSSLAQSGYVNGPPHGVANVCSTISDWTSSALNSGFNALTVGPSSNAALNFIGGLWNSAVALAKGAITGIASALTASVLSAIRTGLGVAGVASMAISMLQNLRLKLKPSQLPHAFGVSPHAGLSGTVSVTLGSAAGFKWSADLVNCAQDLGITLPSLSSAGNYRIDWGLSSVLVADPMTWCAAATPSGSSGCPLAAVESSKTQFTLDRHHTAKMTFLTSTESKDQATRGKFISDDYATVSPIAVPSAGFMANLKKLLTGITLGNGVPDAAKITFGNMFKSLTNSLLFKLTQLARPSAEVETPIAHHAFPARLPARTCQGLFSLQDFLATRSGVLGGSGGSVCFFTGHNGLGDAVLNPEFDASFAHSLFLFWERSYSWAPLKNVGDEAASGCALKSGGLCRDRGAVVRVANDVLAIEAPSVSPSALLPKGVRELCPDCTFPTSPPPGTR